MLGGESASEGKSHEYEGKSEMASEIDMAFGSLVESLASFLPRSLRRANVATGKNGSGRLGLHAMTNKRDLA